jgi:Stage II sporulation protein E (SpoIIE)
VEDYLVRAARRPRRVLLVVLAVEIAVSAPFLVVSASAVRGVPGPLIVAAALVAAFLGGPWVGVIAMAIATALGVWLLQLNPVATPVVWLPVSWAVGVVGVRIHRSERLRADLLRQLRGGLVALSDQTPLGHLDVVSRYLPAVDAQILAGDFYGIVREPDGSVAVLIGDVVGHGPEAAAVATHLRAAWRSLAVAGVPASQVAYMLNDALFAEREAGRSATLASVCLGSIQAERSTACFVSAGHPPPILMAATGPQPLALPANPMLGVEENREYEATDVILPHEPWSLLLYTDGLIDGRARPNGERPFGEHRLVRQLAAFHPPLTAPTIDTLIAAIQRANGEPMQDDVVVITLSPSSPHAQAVAQHANGPARPA